MESFLFLSFILLLSLLLLTILLTSSKSTPRRLPPGNKGWPLIGETIAFLKAFRRVESEKFFFERMAKHSSKVFTTSILGEPIIVLCGAAGNKFLFSNSNKLIGKWHISSTIRRIFPDDGIIDYDDRKAALHSFVGKAESLHGFVPIMDDFAVRHFDSHWNQNQVEVYPLAKKYALGLASRLFLSIESDEIMEKIRGPMESIGEGIPTLPINLPWTPFRRAMKASEEVKLKILGIVREQRRLRSDQNLLSRFLQVCDDDMVVTTTILGMLFAGYDTLTSVLTMIFKLLAQHPHVYQRVFEENMEVAAKKGCGEKLNWEDTQKLKYTWNVVRETMRLYSPSILLSREALADFTFAGYHIPKGSKLMTSVCATQMDPKYFPEPEKFEPSRFDGNSATSYTYTPFGGGATMCPGRNYAQLAILVFVHNAVKRFKWEPLFPNEEMTVELAPKPAQGLPVLLHRHPTLNQLS